MQRPKKKIPGLVVAALALTGCGGAEGTAGGDQLRLAGTRGDGATNGGGARMSSGGRGGMGGSGASGGTGGRGGMGGSGASAGSGGRGGMGGIGASVGAGGRGGMGGAAGAGGIIGPTMGQGFEAFCLRLGECYSEMSYTEACLIQLPSIELLAQSLPNECDELIGSYFSCLGELPCDELIYEGYDSCSVELEEDVLSSCPTILPLP